MLKSAQAKKRFQTDSGRWPTSDQKTNLIEELLQIDNLMILRSWFDNEQMIHQLILQKSLFYPSRSQWNHSSHE